MRTVPTATFGPILESLIHQRWPDRDSEGIAILAEKVGCSWDAIDGIIRQQHEGCEFNLADDLLCALGMPMLWREEPLDAIYFAIDLSWVYCQCPGCNTRFQLQKDTMGREVYRKYCSRQCNQAAYKIRNKRIQHRQPLSRRGRVGRPVGVTELKCRKGHERTPENTRHRSNGKIECAICAREANKASYHRRKREAVPV